MIKSGTPPPSPSVKQKTERQHLDASTLSALPRHMQQTSAPSTPGSVRYLHRCGSGRCTSSKRHSALFALQAQVRTTLPVNIGSVAEDQGRGQFPEEQGGGRRLRHHQRVLPDLILIPLPGENTESWEMNEQDSSTYSL